MRVVQFNAFLTEAGALLHRKLTDRLENLLSGRIMVMTYAPQVNIVGSFSVVRHLFCSFGACMGVHPLILRTAREPLRHAVFSPDVAPICLIEGCSLSHPSDCVCDGSV